MTGTAAQYDIRYSISAIDASNRSSATSCDDEPTPGDPGIAETYTASGLTSNTTYYFAVKAAHDVPNWSGLSNVTIEKTAVGVIVAWGNNGWGQCDVPPSNADFVAGAGGVRHSLGLKSDGTIVAWGYYGNGQCKVPAPNADFVAVVAGVGHSLGLKSDGTIVAWGNNDYGQCNVPTPNEGFVAIDAGGVHSLGVK